MTNIVAIAAGASHSLGLTSDGGIVGWGYNLWGQATVPSRITNIVAVAAGGDHSLALTAEGKVVAWGRYYSGQTNVPTGLSNVVDIAAGGAHSLALTADGRVVAWGDSSATLPHIATGLSNIVAIEAGGRHSLALTTAGRVICWGANDSGQTNVPGGLSNVVAIAAGGLHSLALKADGSVVGWGFEDNGQTNVPGGLSNALAIAAGGLHSLAISPERGVVTWGSDDYGQAIIPSEASGSFAIRAGGSFSLALTGDASPAIAAQPRSQPAAVGSAVTLEIIAFRVAGSPMLRYQWQKGGANLPRETNATIQLLNISSNDAGSYTVIVSNYAGNSTTSSLVLLTVTCELNVSSTAGGSVSRSIDLPEYQANSLVSLTALPTLGYGFVRWSGDAVGGDNPLTVSMNTNKTIVAVFAAVTVALGSNGVGTVAKLPDKAIYSVGEQVTLSAAAGRWHQFSNWTDGNTNNPRVVSINESNTGSYTAVFTPTTPLETITIGNVTRVAPVGMPVVVVDGVFIVAESVSARASARFTLSTTFPNGTLLYTLDGADPALAGNFYTTPFYVRNTCLLRIIAYNAMFSQWVAGDPLAVAILPTLTGLTDGGGSVAIEPAVGAYFSNSLASVTATASPGWGFLHWLGDATGTSFVLNLSMTRDKSVRAVFGTLLSTAIVGGGSIVIDPTASAFPFGSRVRLTAVPASGNFLAFWANAASGMTNNPLTFIVTNANPTVTAVFTSLGGGQTNSLTVIPNGSGQVTLTPPGNRFPRNTNVVLHAVAEAGQDFLGWSGAVGGTENPLVVTMTSNTVLTANFTFRPQLQGEGYRELLSQEGFRLTLTGDWGVAYRIDHSTNLTEWTPLTTLTNTFGTVQFTDGAGTNLPLRFYRAVSPP